MAFAALGAAEMLSIEPENKQALSLIGDAAAAVGRRQPDPAWPWLEARLTYANAVLPEAMIAAGVALDRVDLLDDGLALLSWLLDHETLVKHLSVVPVGGAGCDDRAPLFDQQPLEVAALADACARAATVKDSGRWGEGVRLAIGWFLGENDIGSPMWDPKSGGGYDGLCHDGPNLNQGAESTLALVAVLQHAVVLDSRTALLQ